MRNRRRSILNIISVAIGITIMINGLGWLRGLTAMVYDSVIGLDTGHVQILNKDYQAEKRRLPLDIRMEDYQSVMEKIESIDFVAGASARIDTAGELSDGTSSAMVLIRAVIPEREAEVTILKNSIIEGGYFTKPGSVVIGKGLADRFRIKPESQVFVSCLDRYGVRNIIDAEVSGIFGFGYPVMDDSIVFMDMDAASELLSMQDSATRIVVKLDEGQDVRAAVGRITELLSYRKDLAVYDWREFAQAIIVAIESRLEIISTVIGILFALIIIGILNSMSMAVQERFREIGTMRAIGMKRRKLFFMFLTEGFWLGAIGSLAALVLSFFLMWFFSTHGIDVKQLLPKEIPVPFTSLFLPRYVPQDTLLSLGLGACMAIVGSILPAFRAGKMIIQDALGSHM